MANLLTEDESHRWISNILEVAEKEEIRTPLYKRFEKHTIGRHVDEWLISRVGILIWVASHTVWLMRRTLTAHISRATNVALREVQWGSFINVKEASCRCATILLYSCSNLQDLCSRGSSVFNKHVHEHLRRPSPKRSKRGGRMSFLWRMSFAGRYLDMLAGEEEHWRKYENSDINSAEVWSKAEERRASRGVSSK